MYSFIKNLLPDARTASMFRNPDLLANILSLSCILMLDDLLSLERDDMLPRKQQSRSLPRSNAIELRAPKLSIRYERNLGGALFYEMGQYPITTSSSQF
jgi:hypothetical protein